MLGDEYNLGNETDNDQHGIITAPIFSREAYEAAGAGLQLAQYGVLGSLQSTVLVGTSSIPFPHSSRVTVGPAAECTSRTTNDYTSIRSESEQTVTRWMDETLIIF